MSTVISKSVSRAFALFELFGQERRPLSATAIQTALGLPQASALVLARELAALGYLTYDAQARTYFPNERLLNLTNWLGAMDLPVRRLKDLVDEVARATRETASLCSRNGRFLQIDHFCLGNQPGSILMQTGRAAPLPCSGAGRAVLAALSETDASAVIADVRRRDRQYPFDATQAARDVSFARRHGHLVTYDLMIPGIGAVAFPLPPDLAGGCFALVVGAPTPRIRDLQASLVRACHRILAARFPTAASDYLAAGRPRRVRRGVR